MRPLDHADSSSFLAIARHKSFRRAADQLGCTPSALSHALRNVEERLKVRLLNRTTRSVALTEAGERLVERLTPAFRDISDAFDDLNHYRGEPMGTLANQRFAGGNGRRSSLHRNFSNVTPSPAGGSNCRTCPASVSASAAAAGMTGS
jgi:hypothetical protein